MVLDINMAAVLLFWDTNMADVASSKNGLLFEIRNEIVTRFLHFADPRSRVHQPL